MPISDIPASEYHAIKAVSAGMIWEMDASCPLKAWLNSPWNEKREQVTATHFDIGTATHLAVLEPDTLLERVAVHEFADYRTNAAKLFREEAYLAGKIPLKGDEYELVRNLRDAVQLHPIASKLFRQGAPEQSLTWKWNSLECKCRPDWLAADRTYVVDLKTAISAHPRAISRKALLEGWHVRASWYLPGVREATGELPDKYLFVVVEKDPPHICEVYEMDIKALMYGEQIVGRTMRRLAWCFETGEWPGYGEGSITELSLPGWTEFGRAKREENGEFD